MNQGHADSFRARRREAAESRLNRSGASRLGSSTPEGRLREQLRTLKEHAKEAEAERESAEEERERLQHRLMDAEEKNMRLSVELKKLTVSIMFMLVRMWVNVCFRRSVEAETQRLRNCMGKMTL